MQNFFFIQKISRFSVSFLLATVLAILSGCGGGGSTVATANQAGAAGTTIQLLVSSPQMESSGATPVTLTAIVLASGQTVAGKTVTFSAGTDTTAYVSDNSGASNPSGLVTAKLNLGGNKANRIITVTATVDGRSASTTVNVIGTTISISGNSSLAFGASTTLTVNVKDSAGVALPGVPVTLSSQKGNTIALTPASGITTPAGSITANVTASVVGNDVLTATAAGASTTNALTISSASFAFTAPVPVAPATTVEIPLNTPTTVSVYWTNNGVPVAPTPVNFSASRGSITGTATTSGGTASVTISSASAGTAIITAAGPGGTPAATMSVDFVATTASTVTAQANPSTIQVTSGAATQTSNSSQISVIVRDAANNLVKNARVNFSITADPSGGSLSAATATTDVNGSASTSYRAGSTSSPQNGVSISATVVDVGGVPTAPSPTHTVNLTVSGQSLLVRLGTDALVVSAPPINKKDYIAIVTDAGGNPVANATVRFVLRPNQFRKGNYVAGATTWVRAPTVTCPNEDVNFNGIIDPLEDANGNGQLDPGGIASVNATATTDSNGIATATITYPKSHATWVQVVLEARTGVVGNDPPATTTLWLPGLASDYTNILVAPPGQFSPFGTGVLCTDTN